MFQLLDQQLVFSCNVYIYCWNNEVSGVVTCCTENEPACAVIAIVWQSGCFGLVWRLTIVLFRSGKLAQKCVSVAKFMHHNFTSY